MEATRHVAADAAGSFGEEHFGACELGDRRLRQRAVKWPARARNAIMKRRSGRRNNLLFAAGLPLYKQMQINAGGMLLKPLQRSRACRATSDLHKSK